MAAVRPALVAKVSLASTEEHSGGIVTPQEAIRITCMHRGPLVDTMRTFLISLAASDHQLHTSLRELQQNGESRLLYREDLLVGAPCLVLDVQGHRR
jgi:hypothetical protein